MGSLTSSLAASGQAADRRRTQKSAIAVLRTGAAHRSLQLCSEHWLSLPVVSVRDAQGPHHADAKPLLCVRRRKNARSPLFWFDQGFPETRLCSRPPQEVVYQFRLLLESNELSSYA